MYRWLVERSSWLVIGSMNAWLVFMLILYFSKYSNLKLGKDNEKPHYSTVTWFSMIFSASIGSGFFYWAGAEASLHYLTKNKHTNNPFLTDNELAQDAITQTLIHWGIKMKALLHISITKIFFIRFTWLECFPFGCYIDWIIGIQRRIAYDHEILLLPSAWR